MSGRRSAKPHLHKINVIPVPTECPFCGGRVELKSSEVIYGKDHGMMYICTNRPECDSYVGVHEGTDIPLGYLADVELRYWRRLVHSAIDPLWQKAREKRKKREGVYAWIASELGKEVAETHVAWMTKRECMTVLKLVPKVLKKNRTF